MLCFFVIDEMIKVVNEIYVSKVVNNIHFVLNLIVKLIKGKKKMFNKNYLL